MRISIDRGHIDILLTNKNDENCLWGFGPGDAKNSASNRVPGPIRLPSSWRGNRLATDPHFGPDSIRQGTFMSRLRIAQTMNDERVKSFVDK